MNHRENMLRAVHFERPAYIPMSFHINPACWHAYPQDALQELMAEHPFLFPDFEPSSAPVVPQYGPNQRAGQPYTDDWGCVWETTDDGITGTVTRHPLADWDDFERYRPPDPSEVSGLGPIDWEQVAKTLKEAREKGRLAAASLPHGHTFLLLQSLRGYENLVYDMADDEPRLCDLIDMVGSFNLALVRHYVDLGAEWIGYPEDLGMQVGPMISPAHFRRYIKPVYQRLMQPARDAGCIVHMHSDGDIRALVDDLIEGGVQVINLQDLVNGIDWIADRFAGRVCVDLDVDRQAVTRYGTPAQIDALIREEVEKLASKEGGLMMVYGLYPGVPLENARALMDAMTRYATFYA
ncbi:MAG: uroporphyrinogen decarboxylase family protein [Anaerolineae bacterium]